MLINHDESIYLLTLEYVLVNHYRMEHSFQNEDSSAVTDNNDNAEEEIDDDVSKNLTFHLSYTGRLQSRDFKATISI